MPDTYIAIMLQSLKKKEQVLNEIIRLDDLQKNQLTNPESQVEDFEKTVEDKSACIQQLEQLEDRLVYYESGEEGVYPVAVDISDISFVSDCVTNCDAVYIGFLGNTGRSDKISAFVDFLLAWGA